MQVRRVRPEEWRALRAFRLRALETDPRAFGARLEEALGEEEATWRARAAGAEDRAVFVAARDDAALSAWLGMVAAQREEAGDVQLLSMWVPPEARGRGAGAALLDHAARWARERGAPRVTLWVNVEQGHAVALYRRCGFVELGAPVRGTRDPTRIFQRMAICL